jgi:hypothetical protein
MTPRSTGRGCEKRVGAGHGGETGRLDEPADVRGAGVQRYNRRDADALAETQAARLPGRSRAAPASA